jgi:hypothetical protein
VISLLGAHNRDHASPTVGPAALFESRRAFVTPVMARLRDAVERNGR